MDNLIKNKKAVSVMIGYVLLVSLAVIMGGIVYQWMKTYAPTEISEGECDDGVSLFVMNSECTISLGASSDPPININVTRLDLKLKNNGRFDIGGYFIYATNDSNQTIATIDLSKNVLGNISKLNPGIKFAGRKNSFAPGYNITHRFEFTNASFNQITSIEITPIRWQTQGDKEKVVACSAAKIREKITCRNNSGGSGGETPPSGREWEYTGVNYTVNDKDNSPRGLFWDKNNWWIIGNQNNAVYKYYSNWTFAEESYSVEKQEFSDIFSNGSSWFLSETSDKFIHEYDSNWIGLGNHLVEDTPEDIFWNGTFWWVLGNKVVYKYYANWTFTGEQNDISAHSSQPQSIFWYGNNWWVLDFGGGGNNLYKYYNNWTFTGQPYSVDEDSSTYEIFNDNTHWWMLGKDSVYQYYV